MTNYASVVFDLGIDRRFDYRVPPGLEEAVRPGVRVVVPFRSQRLSGFVVALERREGYPGAKEIISVRDREPVVSEPLLKLAEWIASYYFCPLSSAIRCMIPTALRRGHRVKMPIFVHPVPERLADLSAIGALKARAPKGARLIDLLRVHNGPMPLQELLRRGGASRTSVAALEKRGFVELRRQRVYRDPWEGEEIEFEEHLAPTPEQAGALDHARGDLKEGRFSVMLLHGVTGSGKTEVYLQAIDEALSLGKGAIMLVPEISLTPQTVERFKARFPDSIAVLHSHLSDGERLDEWERLKNGKARVVVGARSAVFAPVHNLGIIIVDEEHERTYKQEEAPRYHARDVAVVRGRIEHAMVILGSATPSVESYRNAERGRYRIVHLTRRIEGRAMPSVAIVDMLRETRQTGRITYLSRALLRAMEECLGRGEQVILFLNRRGFAPLLLCRRCGFVQRCPNCSISLTVHEEGSRLLCHLCGHVEKPLVRCPKCGSPGIRFPGIGTQKLEQMVVKLFPEYKVARMDSDSMTAKDAHRETLARFRDGEVRILIGTQMIAKGLHFPNVTLVGVVCADTALHLSDFRASEQTFQLLTQVAGRAGRGDVPGEVIVQSFTPTHPALLAAQRHDYDLFYAREIPFREELGYPPVKRFIALTVRGRRGEAVRWVAGHLEKLLRGSAPRDIHVLGPVPSPISRAKGYYRWQLILKGPRVREMNELLRATLGAMKLGRDVQIVVDVDPMSML
ncbi:MAG: primosomal protein N' [Candidatus Aureabacteria bacterium]|nr:primosomal protein N' [Candidatus Auribacterota bacterium]